MVRAKAKDTSSARTIARQRRAREETAAKRQHLLECARIILREGSIFDLTAISLAQQAGVTRQTVYRYFPNTETIFKALSDQVITQVYEDLQVASEGKDTLYHFVTKAMGGFRRRQPRHSSARAGLGTGPRLGQMAASRPRRHTRTDRL